MNKADKLFEMLQAAYRRGANWVMENGSTDGLNKAAYDYADYHTSPLTIAERADLSASPAGPFEMRHEEGGYVEFLNEEVPTVVREIDGRVAILTTLEQPRKVVGYRVYDPGSSPSEVFGSASPAGVGVETEAKHPIVAASRVYEVLKKYRDQGRFDWDYIGYICRDVAALTKEATHD